MKKIIFLLSVFLFFSCGHKLETMAPVEKVIEAPGTKNQLYVRANNWMVESFNNAKMVVQFSDKEEGIVTGRYMMAPTWGYNGYSVVQSGGHFAIIQIQLKEGATKITVKPEATRYTDKWTSKDAVRNIRSLINSYTAYMENTQLESF